jgi:hypothetical protein
MRIVSCALVASWLFACSAPDSSVTPTSGRVAESTSASTAAGGPASVLTEGRTYWFVFDESPTVVSLMTSKCQKDAPNAVAACLDEIRHEGAREAIRFSGTDTAHLTWTSFGVDEAGKEELFLEVPFAVASVDGAFVRVDTLGAARGRQAEEMAKMGKTAPSKLAFEVVDESTIAMTDPRKGRLLYRSR